MNDLVSQLLQLAPGMAAGLKGNGHAMNAFMQSYQRTNALLDEQARRQQDQLMQQQQYAQNTTRQQEQDRIAAEDRTMRIDDRGRSQAIQTATAMQGAGEGAEDMPGAEQAIDAVYKMLAPEGYQEPLGGIRDMAINQAQQTITARQKRQVSEYVEKALKTSFVADNPDADPEIQNLPEHLVKILGKPSAKLSELQSFAQLPIGKPASKERMPAMAGSFEDYVQRKYGDAATPDQILEARKLYQQSDDRPRITVNTGQGGYPPAQQRRIDAVIKGFDAQPVVKRTQIMAEAVSFADGMDINTKNPSDDQALIYAFAKIMDPESVVREGEYATVQKYAQSWSESFGFDVKRIFSNSPFLTPQARQNMKTTIRAKFGAAKGQYDNLRNEFGRRIERITGKVGGADELTDYGAAFPQQPDAAKPTKRGANPFRPQ